MTTDVEAYDVTRLPAERGSDSLVRPAADTDAILGSFRAYTQLCADLLTVDDYQRIGKKDFKKKSAWRKLGVAFGVSTEIRDETETRDDHDRIVRARVTVRAIAPNGRFADGLGVCDIHEKCCVAEYCTNKSDYHKHCKPGCPGWIHFSGVEHDIPATAFTRASNRAQSDLFGMGEVSAEEVNENAPAHAGPPPVGTQAWAEANGWENVIAVEETKTRMRDELRKLVEAGRLGDGDAKSFWSTFQRPDGPDKPTRPRTFGEYQSWRTALKAHLANADTETGEVNPPESSETPPDLPPADPETRKGPTLGSGLPETPEDAEGEEDERPFDEPEDPLGPDGYQASKEQATATVVPTRSIHPRRQVEDVPVGSALAGPAGGVTALRAVHYPWNGHTSTLEKMWAKAEETETGMGEQSVRSGLSGTPRQAVQKQLKSRGVDLASKEVAAANWSAGDEIDLLVDLVRRNVRILAEEAK